MARKGGEMVSRVEGERGRKGREGILRLSPQPCLSSFIWDPVRPLAPLQQGFCLSAGTRANFLEGPLHF
jgi:hypothetical protein